MARKGKHCARNANAQTPSVTPGKITVVVGVVVLIIGVLWLKNRTAVSKTAVAQAQPTLGVHNRVATFATLPSETPPATPVLADGDAVTEAHTLAPRTGESPEAHLDRLLEEGQPIFAFFHSNTCYQCTEMAKIVDQVYPDFAQQVALVDVNVYDDANQALLQRARIRVIPTLLFIDRAGEGEVSTGVMPATQLQDKLTALAAGGTP